MIGKINMIIRNRTTKDISQRDKRNGQPIGLPVAFIK